MADDFVPASSLAPIPGSSYSLRIGKVHDKWAVRVYRGREILTTEVIGELDPSIIVTVAQSAISLPSYSPYHIVRAVSPLIREARTGYVPPPEVGPARSVPGTPVQPAQPVQRVQPVEPVQSNEVAEDRGSPLLSQIIGERVKEALGPSLMAPSEPTQSVATEVTPKNVPQQKLEPPEKPRIVKKLDLKPVKPEELLERTFSTLMQQLELAITYIYKNYGEKSAARLWEYFGNVAEMTQTKRRNESFEDFIRRRVEEDRILGVEYQVLEFYENRFVGRVKKCGLKQGLAEIVKLSGRLSQDLPCMLCESTWQGTCRAMGFQLEHAKEKDGCTIKVEKPESKK
nr:hypothetical protein [Candidatus Njordarchaeum guaymaensis]